MKTENIILMKMARESLKDRWGLAIGTFAVYILIVGILQSFSLGRIASVVITGPLMLGVSIFSLSLSRNQEARIEQLFEGFDHFLLTLKTYLLMILFIVLWLLLLIVPGIIAAISYSLTFYILADDKTLKPKEALEKSKKMMEGNKWKMFCLGLRFIGWFLLSILTLGIGLLWLIPYAQVSVAKFYDDIKDNKQRN